MTLAEVPVILMLIGIAAYVVLAGADFGAPFWSLTARGERGKEIRTATHQAMAPVWEANHVWLIFVLVVCWTVYPEVFASIFSTLWIPLLLACLGIIMRAVGYMVSGVEDRPWVWVLATVSSFVTPFALGTVVGATVAGEVPAGNAAGDLFTSWLNPTSIMIGILAITLCAYLAAVYLAGDARRTGRQGLSEAFRTRGLVAGAVTGLVGVVGIAVLNEDAGRVYDGLTSGAGLVAVLISAAAGLLTMASLAARRFNIARFSAAAAVAAVIAGWGLAQEPEMLPGLTIESAAASDNVIIGLLVSVAIGLLILIPSLLLLYGLVLGGRFDPGGESTGAGEKTPAFGLKPPRVAIVVLTLIVAAVGWTLTFVSDSGPGLYLGVAMVLITLFGGGVMLAFSLISTDQ
ncbi:MAG: cytochrome d ubiquinol oxidase subunit II [Thermoleophilia bacterium]|nr:cytochrome d ubiquinol oxidase subunit II [Thermoleophilia bacterium]